MDQDGADEEEEERLGEIESFTCPITFEIMKEPVFAMDGMCYEKSAIEAWFDLKGAVSPNTGMALPSTMVVPAHTLRAAIAEYQEKKSRRDQARAARGQGQGAATSSSSSSSVMDATTARVQGAAVGRLGEGKETDRTQPVQNPRFVQKQKYRQRNKQNQN